MMQITLKLKKILVMKYIKDYFYLIFMFKFLLFALAISNQELDLKNEIFDGYSKYVRPVEFEKEITDVRNRSCYTKS